MKTQKKTALVPTKQALRLKNLGIKPADYKKPELLVKRYETIVGVTVGSTPSERAILRKNPPAGCTLEDSNRLATGMHLLKDKPLTSVRLLRCILTAS